MDIKSYINAPISYWELMMLLTRKIWPLKWYLKIFYFIKFGRLPNLSSPVRFSEKLNWEKVYDRNPLYSNVVDKYKVKKIVGDIIGNEYIVPCYGVWNNFDEIDFSKLPEKFILKCTHDSSGIVVCRDKSKIDIAHARKVLSRSLKTNYYWYGREWPYKLASHRIIADELLDDGRTGELQDYKWWCFNGEPKVMYITNKGAAGQVYENFYDMDFNVLDIDHGYPRYQPEYEKPKEFEEMKELARKLSKAYSFIRADFFDIHGKVYFGELTFYDHAGLRPFKENGWDEKLGSWIDLPM